MTTVLFAVITAIHVGLTAWLAVRAARERSWYIAIVALVTLGLVYDNGIVAIGNLVGQGRLLEALSYPRFVIHAVVTPLLIIVAIGMARRADARWASRSWVHALFCLLAAAMIAYGILFELVGLELETASEGGELRYSAVEASAPIPSIAAIVVLIVVGAVLWRRGGLWMFLGALLMFVAAAVPSLPLVVANFGEVALILGIVGTVLATRPAAAEGQ